MYGARNKEDGIREDNMLTQAIDRTKIKKYVRHYLPSDSEQRAEILDSMDEWSDEELLSAIKNADVPFDIDEIMVKSAIDKVPKGLSDKQLELYADVEADISDADIEQYKKQRDKNELDTAESDYQTQRKERQSDVDNLGSLLSNKARNENVTDELMNYDVKSQLQKYIDNGMTKEQALAQVRQDIKDINRRESTASENALKPLGWAAQLMTPQMYIDHYVDTGDYDSAGARARAFGGTALNIAELNPFNPVGKAGLAVKAARIGLKPTVEGVRNNILADDDRNLGQRVGDTVKDIALDASINALSEANPKVLWDWGKGAIGFGGSTEKASKNFFDDLFDSAEALHNNEVKEQTEQQLLNKLGIKKQSDIAPAAKDITSNDEALYDLNNKLKSHRSYINNRLYEYAHNAQSSDVKKTIEQLRSIGKDTEADLLELYHRTDVKPTYNDSRKLTLGKGNITDEKHLNALLNEQASKQTEQIALDNASKIGGADEAKEYVAKKLKIGKDDVGNVELNKVFGDNTQINLTKPWNWREPVKYPKMGKSVNTVMRPVVRAIADANNDKDVSERDVKLIRMWQAGFIPKKGTELYDTYLKWKNNNK